MLPEVRLLLGPAVAHGAVELSAGGHTHGQVPGNALPRPGVVVRSWREKDGTDNPTNMKNEYGLRALVL